jgi:AcrR family transcriptional regulator
MVEHYGQTVEYIVRKNGYSITDLAEGLGVNRRTIYNYFQNKYLKQDIIYRIGLLVRHDFSKEFPEWFTSEQFAPQINLKNNLVNIENTDTNDNLWKDKYIVLLESYNDLLTSKILTEQKSRTNNSLNDIVDQLA